MSFSQSAESRLVFRTADPTCGAAEYGELVRAVRDWERCVRLAETEMAAPTLARAIRHGAFDAQAHVPADVSEHLRRSMMLSDFRMQQLAQRLGETTRAFAALGVPLLLLKGAALGALRDQTFRLRPMSDLDILVHAEDAPTAVRALQAAGWEQTSDPALLLLLTGSHHHLPPFLDSRVPGARVELHLSILPSAHPFALDDSTFWRDATSAPLAFAGAQVPVPELLLLHCCIHFAWQHAFLFGSWRSFRLVAVVTGHPGFSWSRFLAIARRSRASTCCYWTLRLASRMCGMRIPAYALASLAPPTGAVLCAALERHFIAALLPGESAPSPSLALSRLLWRAALRPRWSGHPPSDPFASDERWFRTITGADPPDLRDRLRRHTIGIRRWWDFFARTLRG